jgi:putative transcriptional regulator
MKTPNEDLKIWDASFEENKEVKVGSILLGEPFMLDEYFKKSVLMVCENNFADGTLGFVLNKVTQLFLSDLIEEIEQEDIRIYSGGPCEEDTLHYIHKYGESIKQSIHMGNGLYWGGDFEDIKKYLHNEGYDKNNIRFFIGYSGWQYTQLQDEIKEHTWIINNSVSKLFFEYEDDEMWTKILQEMGGAYKIMTTYPENPIFN